MFFIFIFTCINRLLGLQNKVWKKIGAKWHIITKSQVPFIKKKGCQLTSNKIKLLERGKGVDLGVGLVQWV